MNANLQRKQEIVEEVKGKFEWANFAVLAEYRGIDVAGMSELRRQARASNVDVRIVKNTLARRAVEGTEFECLKDSFQGPIAIALADDPVTGAKVVADFSKDHEAFRFHSGAVNGKLLVDEQFRHIAKLPSREILLAMLAGTAAAPIANFVSALNQIPASFVRTLAAVRDAKAQDGQ